MKVFKFGGASVKSAEAVKNVGSIIERFPEDNLVVVVSAMGKTTNALEAVLNAWYNDPGSLDEKIQQVEDFHETILPALFPDRSHSIYQIFDQHMQNIRAFTQGENHDFYDYDYDGLVSNGELISTNIVAQHLQGQGVNAVWIDARKLIRTNNIYREGRVDWKTTEEMIQKELAPLLSGDQRTVIITQGFIGSTPEGLTTTLGREGSDFTAAILAYCLNAESVTIWKDVPGVLNADPKYFSNTEKLDKISYREAIELSYYGASIIHPKTVKPLENKRIPLYARSFVSPTEKGTAIQKSDEFDTLIPSFIFKVDQMLVSITPKDFSFIAEDNLQHIYSVFARRRVKVRLTQTSALSFSACVDMDEQKIPGLLNELQENYEVRYNDGLELVTIRHYDDATIDRVTVNKAILVDQRTRQTCRMVMRDLG